MSAAMFGDATRKRRRLAALSLLFGLLIILSLVIAAPATANNYPNISCTAHDDHGNCLSWECTNMTFGECLDLMLELEGLVNS